MGTLPENEVGRYGISLPEITWKPKLLGVPGYPPSPPGDLKFTFEGGHIHIDPVSFFRMVDYFHNLHRWHFQVLGLPRGYRRGMAWMGDDRGPEPPCAIGKLRRSF